MGVMRPKLAKPETEIARIATRAFGIVTRGELVGVGLTRDEIKHRLRSGLLIREHRGVYRVGHRAPSVEARYMAAVKACGEGGVLSGLAAAQLLGLVRAVPSAVEVTVPKKKCVPGLRVRCRQLARREVTRVDGIPVTTVPRTVVDLAAILNDGDLARACHEAGVKYRTTPAQVDSVIARCSQAPGVQRLRRVMSGDAKVLLSQLERLFLNRLRAAGLPLPETNKVASGRRVDCRWPDRRLTVELQSYRFHNSRHAWEHDHARRRGAHARGDTFRQFTWEDLTAQVAATVEELRGLLTAP